MSYPNVTLPRHARAPRRTAPTRSVSFDSERDLQAQLEAFFARLAIPHKAQHPVGDGAADIMLELPDGRPWALLELKNGLDADLTMAAAADYLEQAVKYRMASGLPVFVGPFWQSNMGVVNALYEQRYPALSALSALGGRLDVGLFFLHAIAGCATDSSRWYGFQLVLRQTRVATYSGDVAPTVWPAEPLPLVDLFSAGSRKDRR